MQSITAMNYYAATFWLFWAGAVAFVGIAYWHAFVTRDSNPDK